MSTPEVRLSVADRVALLVIDRPAVRNAIDRPAIAALGSALDEVEAGIDKGEIGVLAIRGGGDRVFISGGDLKELASIRTEPEAEHMATSMRRTLDRIARLAVPTVAVLNGDAYGGGAEVAVACDIRIAADDIRIGFTQVVLGIMPAWGGIERLTTLVGRGRAADLLLTGHVLSAQEAYEYRLVERVIDRASFDETAHALLAQIASAAPLAARGIKAVLTGCVPAPASELAQMATRAFARSWVADEHWEAAERAAQRRLARATAANSDP